MCRERERKNLERRKQKRHIGPHIYRGTQVIPSTTILYAGTRWPHHSCRLTHQSTMLSGGRCVGVDVCGCACTMVLVNVPGLTRPQFNLMRIISHTSDDCR